MSGVTGRKRVAKSKQPAIAVRKSVRLNGPALLDIPASGPSLLTLLPSVHPDVQSVVLSRVPLQELCRLARLSGALVDVVKSAMQQRQVDISILRGRPRSRYRGCMQVSRRPEKEWGFSSSNDRCGDVVNTLCKSVTIVDNTCGTEDTHEWFEKCPYTDESFYGFRRLPLFLMTIVRNCNINSLDLETILTGGGKNMFDFEGYRSVVYQDNQPYVAEEFPVGTLKLRYEYVSLLKFLTPKHLVIKFSKYLKFYTKDDIRGTDLRGLFSESLKSVSFNHIGREVDDDMLSRLKAEKIIVGDERLHDDYMRYFCVEVDNSEYPGNTMVTRQGLVHFIQQWLRKERVVHHVALLLPESESKIGSPEFYRLLMDDLREFDSPSHSVEPAPSVDKVEERLLFKPATNGMIYSDPLVFHVDRSDKKLVVVLREESEPRRAWRKGNGDMMPFKEYVKWKYNRFSPKKPTNSPLLYSLVIEMFED